MRLSRIFRTASFRLAAAYALLFSASVAVLAVVVYVSATAALDREERARLETEARALAGEYHRGGLPNLLNEIHARARARLAGGFDYGVVEGGARIYGDIPPMALESGWTRIKGPPDGDEPPGQREHLLVYSSRLKPGLWLQVGDDVGREKVFGKAIMATFAWFLAVVATLAIAGGVFISVSVLRRIDSITRTAEAIIEGDLDRRVPLRGVADDIDRLASTLNRMLDRISLLLGALRQVSRHIAHDLRTPLGRLRQGLEDARAHAAQVSDYEVAIGKAVAETDEILATFTALLRIAQIEAGTRRAGFQAVDLSALALHIADSYVPVAESAGKQVTLAVMPDVTVTGDRELLTQLLVNLIENAIRHTGPGSQIGVEVLGGTKPALIVSDNGPGIPEDERRRIERRSYRAERGARSEGWGLGLSLVAAVCDLHRAELKFSDLHPGASVCVLFAQSAAAAGGAPAAARDQPAESAATAAANWRRRGAFAPSLARKTSQSA